jgi:hypothetical protein
LTAPTLAKSAFHGAGLTSTGIAFIYKTIAVIVLGIAAL